MPAQQQMAGRPLGGSHTAAEILQPQLLGAEGEQCPPHPQSSKPTIISWIVKWQGLLEPNPDDILLQQMLMGTKITSKKAFSLMTEAGQ